MNVFRTPSPTPPPSPKEEASSDNFTVLQLQHLHNQVIFLILFEIQIVGARHFFKVGVFSYVSCNLFFEISLSLLYHRNSSNIISMSYTQRGYTFSPGTSVKISVDSYNHKLLNLSKTDGQRL